VSDRHRAGRIPLHPEAFSHDLRSRSKRPRQEMREHLNFIRGLRCLVCPSRNWLKIQAAHIRTPSPAYGKRSTGLGEKPSDTFVLPLCVNHHAEQHQGSELAFWARYGIADPFAVALALFAATGDDERAELIIKQARICGP
jgi:hypothetical protein